MAQKKRKTRARTRRGRKSRKPLKGIALIAAKLIAGRDALRRERRLTRELRAQLAAHSAAPPVAAPDPAPPPPEFRFVFQDKSDVQNKVAEADLHFLTGALAGHKLVGFTVWIRKEGQGFNVTLPSRPYSVDGSRRSYTLLRPIEATAVPGGPDIHEHVKTLVLTAYAAYRAEKGGPAPVPVPKSRGHLYMGVLADGTTREVFSHPTAPTQAEFPQYSALIGPFRTQQGAEYMRLHGAPGSRCQSVDDAEQLAAQAAQAAQKGGAA